ncbi:hypothetical protein O9929_19340 [Vibrio lentus]|nr:hypothetical protein [Vibrio lentus]
MNCWSDEQSGQINPVGFTLYMEMLEQAVEALKRRSGNHRLMTYCGS